MFLIHNKPEQADLLASALVAVHRPDNKWYVPAQENLAHTLFLKLLKKDIDFNSHPAISPGEVANILNFSNERTELLELLVAFEMLCSPIPKKLEYEIEKWANILDVNSDVLTVSRELADNAINNATTDFYRLNWIGEGDHQDDPIFKELVNKYGNQAYGLCIKEDLKEFEKWNNLQFCPSGSLGETLWHFYNKRGFKLPGQLGAGNAALAHHDWIHIIAGYDTTPIGELEVTAFMASSSEYKGVTLGFIGAISILETGLLHSFFGADKFPKSLTTGDGISRVSEAINRGKSCLVDPLKIDFFEIASSPLKEIRCTWWNK